jgi:hypothetical protein
MLRRALPVLALVIVLLALPVASQAAGVRATLILTSGEVVKGQLIDLGGVGFTMMEGGNEVRFPENQVALIDFVGGGQNIPAAEIGKMQGGRALIVQRGGDFFYGRLYDIGGDNPLRFTFNTGDGQVEMNSNEIARVYLRRWEGMPQGR